MSDQPGSEGDDLRVPARYSAADAFLDAMQQMGITHLFVNFGSDHPEIIEALAARRAAGKLEFKILVCPHESTALAAAHGFTLLNRQPAAVLVHVDAGTQTLGGAVHNACRGRAPVLIFAGETPITIEGELFGSRNRPAQILQDVADQHGIVRSYVKTSLSVRTGRNIRQVVCRAMQMASSEPCGPVYVTAAREILSETLEAPTGAVTEAIGCRWPLIAPTALGNAMVREIATALLAARRPLIVTAYCGRHPAAVATLQRLAEHVGVAIIEESPTHLNLPRDHALHAGFDAAAVISDADLVLVLDCDVPWVNALVRLPPDLHIYHIDSDPLKTGIPLWHLPAVATCQADSLTALEQLDTEIRSAPVDTVAREERLAWVADIVCRRQAKQIRPGATSGNPLSPSAVAEDIPASAPAPVLAADVLGLLSQLLDDDAIVIDETVTHSAQVLEQLPRRRPGTYFSSGGAALGFGCGAAVGVKLAAPQRTVVCLCGDGSFLFSVPSAVYMIAARYHVPFLTVILNNGGWNATKQNVLRMHPEGAAKHNDSFWVHLNESADLAGIAAAAGCAFARTVTHPDDLQGALGDALAALERGVCAVVDVRLARISGQSD